MLVDPVDREQVDNAKAGPLVARACADGLEVLLKK
jgi:hypothetical protein